MPLLLILAAEAAAAIHDISEYLPAVSTLGSLGFAVWYAYYTTTVAIPKLLEAHRTERLELQERFDAALHELLVELKEQRTQFATWMTRGRD